MALVIVAIISEGPNVSRFAAVYHFCGYFACTAIDRADCSGFPALFTQKPRHYVSAGHFQRLSVDVACRDNDILVGKGWH